MMIRDIDSRVQRPIHLSIRSMSYAESLTLELNICESFALLITADLNCTLRRIQTDPKYVG